MTRTLFLHIGSHKTGTTSIQNFLAHNRDLLAARGYGYPVTGKGLNLGGVIGNTMAEGDPSSAHIGMGRRKTVLVDNIVSQPDRKSVV